MAVISVAMWGSPMGEEKVVYWVAERDTKMVFYSAAELASLMVSWPVVESVACWAARMEIHMVVH